MFVAIGATREESGEWDAPIARKKNISSLLSNFTRHLPNHKSIQIQTSSLIPVLI